MEPDDEMSQARVLGRSFAADEEDVSTRILDATARHGRAMKGSTTIKCPGR